MPPRWNTRYVKPQTGPHGTGFAVSIPRKMWGARVDLLEYKSMSEATGEDTAPLVLTPTSEITPTHDPEGFETVLRVRCEANALCCGTFRKLHVLVPSGGLDVHEFRNMAADPPLAELPSPGSSHLAWHLEELEPGLPQELVAHIYTRSKPFRVEQVHANFISMGDLVSGVRVFCTMDEGPGVDPLAFPVLEGEAPKMIVREVVGRYRAACAEPSDE